MPNVNYRGKPSQDPNVPPESGVTSIPLGAPWPPLSREQVAELHQELVEFYDGMKRCVDLGINDSAKAAYAERLTIVLHRLGIGSPPPTRTWTHEEVAKVAEEVQTFTDSQSDKARILAMSAPGRTTVLATRSPYLWTPDGRLRAMSPGEIASIVEGADGKPTFRITQGDAMPAGTDRDYLLVASAPDVPRRQEGQWEEPTKRNCWTCRLGSEQFCPLTQGANVGTAKREDVVNWRLSHLQVTQQTDGCPGWEPKNETAKRECWTCGSFHINNGCGKKGTASTALAAHLKKMDDMIDGGASTTEVASMDLNCPGWEPKP